MLFNPLFRPRTLVAGLLALAAMVALPSLAQFKGPVEPTATTTVAAILKQPIDDQPVLLTGKIVRKIAHDKYLFSDGKDSITVEIKDRLFPAKEITPNTPIEVWGEVEKDLLEAPEVDVKSMRVLE